MKVIIDIPEDVKDIIDKNGTNEIVNETLWQAVKNSTPLDDISAEIKNQWKNYEEQAKYVDSLGSPLEVVFYNQGKAEGLRDAYYAVIYQ